METILKNISGKKEIKVTTVVAPKPEEKQMIINFLVKKQAINPTDIDWFIDKTIIAGIKIKIGDNLIDRSYEAVLNKMQGDYYE